VFLCSISVVISMLSFGCHLYICLCISVVRLISLWYYYHLCDLKSGTHWRQSEFNTTDFVESRSLSKLATNQQQSRLLPIRSTLLPIQSTLLPIRSTLLPIRSTLLPIRSTLLPIQSTLLPVLAANRQQCAFDSLLQSTLSPVCT